MPSIKNLVKRKSVEGLSAVLLFIISLGVWWLSSKFPDLPEGYPGPKLFPRIIAIGLFIIAGILLIRSFTYKAISGDRKVLDVGEKDPIRLITGIAFIFLFPFYSPLTGFVPALLMTGIVMGLVLRVKWWKALLVSGITVGVVYLIFSNLLGVPL